MILIGKLIWTPYSSGVILHITPNKCVSREVTRGVRILLHYRKQMFWVTAVVQLWTPAFL